MSKPNHLKITLGERRRVIEQLAKREKRSLSAMINVLIDEALEGRGINPHPTAETIAELVSQWGDLEELAAASRVKLERLQEITSGAYPTDLELIHLARLFPKESDEVWSTSDLILLRDRTFPNVQHTNGEPMPNGT